MNKNSELEIIKLYKRLAELLSNKKAIADLNILLEQHLELFVGKEQSHNLIKRLIEQKISK
ncbi:hypothetical protein [Campylobacter vicugnae]|uniref:hypothetical protein n=1 Tax=Campylobacter vicugnae TaxID=1660076 RepID=UPI000A355A6E|nr:hypothetical protein [Campylobacter sp. RM8964]